MSDDVARRLLALLDGYRAVQALYVAAQLGIPDLLFREPHSSDTLAAVLGADAPSLHRLLRALSSLDVVEENADGSFSLRERAGHLLRSDHPESLRAAVLMYGGRRHWTAWGSLLESVKSGSTVFGERNSQAFADAAARHPEATRVFNDAMAALSAPVLRAVTAAYDFSSIGTLVDVGGGTGSLLCGILRTTPRLRGVLFDIAAVIEAARPQILAAGLGNRCAVVAGDAFEHVPTGGDLYLLKWVLHDWDDDLSTQLLIRCRAAMHADAKLLIIERVLPARAVADDDDASMFLSDLNMLLLSGGRERTEEQYRTLLAAGGFVLNRIIPTSTPNSIIEAALPQKSRPPDSAGTYS